MAATPRGGGTRAPTKDIANEKGRTMAMNQFRAPRVVGTGMLTLTGLGMMAVLTQASASRSVREIMPTATLESPLPQAPAEIVVYASDLPKRALAEFDFWNDPASPGGKLVGTPNEGGDLDAPPENDPHVTFTVQVQAGVPYRCWVHMKVGPPKGIALANKLYVQVSGAVDGAGRAMLKPRSTSYLTANGPTRQGWHWVACDAPSGSSDPLIQFASSGEVTVRVQAGMEGVGFDQFVLSPSRFLKSAPTEPVVPKS